MWWWIDAVVPVLRHTAAVLICTTPSECYKANLHTSHLICDPFQVLKHSGKVARAHGIPKLVMPAWIHFEHCPVPTESPWKDSKRKPVDTAGNMQDKTCKTYNFTYNNILIARYISFIFSNGDTHGVKICDKGRNTTLLTTCIIGIFSNIPQVSKKRETSRKVMLLQIIVI